MIITKLMGGMGNQMFQYAAGRALAERHDTELVLDLEWFEKNKGATPRKYALSIFPLNAAIAKKRQIDTLLREERSFINRVKRRLKYRSVKAKCHVIEPTIRYWNLFTGLPDKVYLEGYWQSPKYFLSIAGDIRSEFFFPAPADDLNKKMLNMIKESTNSVFVHVRRGDYVGHPVHGVNLESYYKKAIAKIKQELDNPNFFVFSDDLSWIKNNWDRSNPAVLVAQNDCLNAWKDMFLMSQCRHAIIANSSFSWWGAWLQSSNEHVVIAPKKWFLNDDLIYDRICENWYTL